MFSAAPATPARAEVRVAHPPAPVRAGLGLATVLLLLAAAGRPAGALPPPASGSVQPAPTPLVARAAPAGLAADVVRATPVVLAPSPVRPAAVSPWRRRGPVEVRDEWLLSQPRLTLPPTSPDPLPCGTWQVRVAVNRGNDFGWRQTREGELPQAGDRRFLVDGEHQTAELGVRRALTGTWDVGVRVPVQWRGAGFLDGIIDWFHELTGAMDNIRPAFLNDRFRVEGRTPDFTPFSWNDETGVGLGRVELNTHWACLPPRPGRSLSAALIARLTLPTGTGPFEVGGVDAGLQAVAAWHLAPRLDAYGGVGGTWFSEAFVDGVEYERLRGHAFLGVEYQVGRTWSLIAVLDGATKLTANVAEYPSVQIYVNLAAQIDLSRRWTLQLGFTENLEDQQSTIDFGAYAGVVGRF